MTDRQSVINGFLQDAGWQDAVRRPLAGDASPRRYDRLTRDKAPFQAVLMDAPAEKGEDIRPFLKVGRYLLTQGLSAPEIYAEDESKGLILLEDLGDDLLARVCAKDPRSEAGLYQASVDLLAELVKSPNLPDVPPYDQATYQREADLLTKWYLPAVTGRKTSDAVQGRYTGLIQSACRAITPENPCLVLRDYHAENLLWLPDRSPPQCIGLLDFQDALIGHPAYDLVSLLEDARRDTGPALRTDMIARFLAATGFEPEAFHRAYATLGAQRNLKIIGIFSRLCLRDGKAGYVDLIPRVWAHLMRDLAHPALADLKSWVAENVPAPDKQALDLIRAGRA